MQEGMNPQMAPCPADEHPWQPLTWPAAAAAVFAALIVTAWRSGEVPWPVAAVFLVMALTFALQSRAKFTLRADTLGYGLFPKRFVTLSALTSARAFGHGHVSQVVLTDSHGQHLVVNLLGLRPRLDNATLDHIEQATAHAPLPTEDREFLTAHLDVCRANANAGPGLRTAQLLLPILIAAPIVIMFLKGS
jgi:hypothetical protein